MVLATQILRGDRGKGSLAKYSLALCVRDLSPTPSRQPPLCLAAARGSWCSPLIGLAIVQLKRGEADQQDGRRLVRSVWEDSALADKWVPSEYLSCARYSCRTDAGFSREANEARSRTGLIQAE